MLPRFTGAMSVLCACENRVTVSSLSSGCP